MARGLNYGVKVNDIYHLPMVKEHRLGDIIANSVTHGVGSKESQFNDVPVIRDLSLPYIPRLSLGYPWVFRLINRTESEQ